MIQKIQQKVPLGSLASITLKTGQTVTGLLNEISVNSITLVTENGEHTILGEMVGAFQKLNTPVVSSPTSNKNFPEFVNSLPQQTVSKTSNKINNENVILLKDINSIHSEKTALITNDMPTSNFITSGPSLISPLNLTSHSPIITSPVVPDKLDRGMIVLIAKYQSAVQVARSPNFRTTVDIFPEDSFEKKIGQKLVRIGIQPETIALLLKKFQIQLPIMLKRLKLTKIYLLIIRG